MYLTVRLFIAHAILTACVARHHRHRGNGTQRGSRKEFVSHEHWWKDGNDWVTNGRHDNPDHDVTHHFHDHFHDHDQPHHGDQGEEELFNRPPFIHENEYHHPDNRQDTEFHHHIEEPYHHINELHHDDLPHGVEIHHGVAHEYGIPHNVPTSEFHHSDFHITSSRPGSEYYLTNSRLHHDDNYAHHVDESEMMREAEHHLNEHEHVHEHEGEAHGHAAMMEDAEHHACSNCDSNADCVKGLCTCKEGYYGDGHLCQLDKVQGHEILVEHEVEPHDHEHGQVVLVEPHRADHHDMQEFHHLDEAHESGMDESQMMRIAEHRVNERERALERQGEAHAHAHLMDEAEHRNPHSYEDIHHLVDPQEPESCDVNPCENGGHCRMGAHGPECACAGVYRGRYCETDNPCMPNPCRHGGICHLFGDDSRCVCTNDRHGRYCDMERSVMTDMERHTPACHSNPCRNGGTCIDEYHGGYKCICRMGWIGSFCQYRENDDPCVPNPCHNHQNCIDYGDSFRCKCDDGWEDAPCEEGHNCGCEPAPEPGPTMGPTRRPSSTRPHTPSRTPPAKTTKRPPKTSPKPPANAPAAAVESPCHPNPCQNGGTCHEFDGGHNYNCICAVGYDGTHCQEDICAGCHVFAFCPNGKCKCRHGYRGDGYDCYKDPDSESEMNSAQGLGSDQTDQSDGQYPPYQSPSKGGSQAGGSSSTYQPYQSPNGGGNQAGGEDPYDQTKSKNKRKDKKPPKINVEFVRAHSQFGTQSAPIYALSQGPSSSSPPSPPYSFGLPLDSSSSQQSSVSTYLIQQPSTQTSQDHAHSPHSHLCLCEENCPRSPYCTPACCGDNQQKLG